MISAWWLLPVAVVFWVIGFKRGTARYENFMRMADQRVTRLELLMKLKEQVTIALSVEQWNGLVALMRAIGVAAGRPDDYDAKRQAGACEAEVRKLFVCEDE